MIKQYKDDLVLFFFRTLKNIFSKVLKIIKNIKEED